MYVFIITVQSNLQLTQIAEHCKSVPSLLFSKGMRRYCIIRMYDLSFIVYFVS